MAKLAWRADMLLDPKPYLVSSVSREAHILSRKPRHKTVIGFPTVLCHWTFPMDQRTRASCKIGHSYGYIIFRGPSGWLNRWWCLLPSLTMPNLNLVPRNPQGRRRKSAPTNCPWTSTCTLWRAHSQAHLHTSLSVHSSRDSKRLGTQSIHIEPFYPLSCQACRMATLVGHFSFCLFVGRGVCWDRVSHVC